MKSDPRNPTLALLRRFACVLLLGFPLPAWSASPVYLYSDRTAWNQAVGSHTDIDFEGLAPAGGFAFYPTPPGLTQFGVNFTIDHSTNNGSLYVVGPSMYYADNSALSSQQSAPAPQNILVTLPAGTTGLALDFGDLGGSGGSLITFNFSGGMSFTATTPPYDGFYGPSWFGFIGFVSTVPLTSLEIVHTSDSSNLEIDNFSYSLASVPEPSAWALMTLGLLIVGWRLRAAP